MAYVFKQRKGIEIKLVDRNGYHNRPIFALSLSDGRKYHEIARIGFSSDNQVTILVPYILSGEIFRYFASGDTTNIFNDTAIEMLKEMKIDTFEKENSTKSPKERGISFIKDCMRISDLLKNVDAYKRDGIYLTNVYGHYWGSHETYQTLVSNYILNSKIVEKGLDYVLSFVLVLIVDMVSQNLHGDSISSVTPMGPITPSSNFPNIDVLVPKGVDKYLGMLPIEYDEYFDFLISDDFGKDLGKAFITGKLIGSELHFFVAHDNCNFEDAGLSCLYEDTLKLKIDSDFSEAVIDSDKDDIVGSNGSILLGLSKDTLNIDFIGIQDIPQNKIHSGFEGSVFSFKVNDRIKLDDMISLSLIYPYLCSAYNMNQDYPRSSYNSQHLSEFVNKSLYFLSGSF